VFGYEMEVHTEVDNKKLWISQFQGLIIKIVFLALQVGCLINDIRDELNSGDL